MNYTEWEKNVPGEIRGDSLWKITAYRLALFVTDVGWRDVTKLTTMIPQQRQRKRTLREATASYYPISDVQLTETEWKQNVPLPDP